MDRQGCALVLANNLTPENEAALDARRAELEAKSVRVREGSWGYRLLVVDALDGNQLLFNYPRLVPDGVNS